MVRPERDMKTDPFRDEVAIDFPAVGRVLERVRDGFLADGERDLQHPLIAEIRVSSTQAYRGAIVPIEVELRGACETCGGRGETWSEMCAQCQGTGNAHGRHLVRVPVPPGVADGSRLHFRVRLPHERPVRVEVRVAIGQDLAI
jgi:hypothetical protein